MQIRNLINIIQENEELAANPQVDQLIKDIKAGEIAPTVVQAVSNYIQKKLAQTQQSEVEPQPQFVEVRISCVSYRVILFWLASMLLLLFFVGFVMYTLISQYKNQGLNNTNSTNVTTTDVHN